MNYQKFFVPLTLVPSPCCQTWEALGFCTGSILFDLMKSPRYHNFRKDSPTTIVEKIPLILAHSTDDSMIFASKHEFVWTSGPLDPRVHHFPFADVLELRSDQLIIIFPHSTTILWVYGIHPFSNILTLGDFPIRGARPMTPSSLFPQWLGEDQKTVITQTAKGLGCSEFPAPLSIKNADATIKIIWVNMVSRGNYPQGSALFQVSELL